MDRYTFFKDLLEMIDGVAVVTDARLKDCFGDIRINAEIDEHEVTIVVSFKDKEEKHDEILE